MRQRPHPFVQAKEALSYAKLLLKRAIIMRKPESTQIEFGTQSLTKGDSLLPPFTPSAGVLFPTCCAATPVSLSRSDLPHPAEMECHRPRSRALRHARRNARTPRGSLWEFHKVFCEHEPRK